MLPLFYYLKPIIGKKILTLVLLTSFLKPVFGQLNFTNNAPHTIWVAVAYSVSGDWVSEGWYVIEPGEKKTIVSGVLKNRYYYFYAKGKDDEYMAWSGNYNFLVKSDAFTIVDADNTGLVSGKSSSQYSVRGFIQLDVGSSLWHNHTLNAPNGCRSGDCEDGIGTYYWYDASRYYTGEWKDGYRYGKGKATYGAYHEHDGCAYDGEWAGGRYHGYGIFTYADGKRFEGNWVESKKNGKGVLYESNGKVIQAGLWKDDLFVGEIKTAEISWISPSQNTRTSAVSQTIRACIKSSSAISELSVYCNGAIVSQTRAPQIVENNGCAIEVNRSIPLKTGNNDIYIQFKNNDGVTSSSTITIIRETPNLPPPSPTPIPVVAGKRLALVIGNGDYVHSSALRNPVNDASELSQTLGELGFKVLHYENLDLNGMKKAVQDFGVQLKGYELGMFFFSGHGVQVKGRNYLIPTDAKLDYESDTEFQCVDAGTVLAKMEGAQSKVNLVVLDACRNNPFDKAWSRDLNSGGLASMTAPVGTIVAYSTSPGKTASDGNGKNGLYTAELLRCLRIPNLKIEEMFKQVRIGVIQTSGKAQTPWEVSSLTGEVILNKQN